MPYRQPDTVRSLRKELVGDSRERERLMGKLLQLVRQEEREKVLSITNKARQRAEDR